MTGGDDSDDTIIEETVDEYGIANLMAETSKHKDVTAQKAVGVPGVVTVPGSNIIQTEPSGNVREQVVKRKRRKPVKFIPDEDHRPKINRNSVDTVPETKISKEVCEIPEMMDSVSAGTSTVVNGSRENAAADSSKITIQKQPIRRMIISKRGASRKRRGGLAQGGQLAQVINNLSYEIGNMSNNARSENVNTSVLPSDVNCDSLVARLNISMKESKPETTNSLTFSYKESSSCMPSNAEAVPSGDQETTKPTTHNPANADSNVTTGCFNNKDIKEGQDKNVMNSVRPLTFKFTNNDQVEKSEVVRGRGRSRGRRRGRGRGRPPSRRRALPKLVVRSGVTQNALDDSTSKITTGEETPEMGITSEKVIGNLSNGQESNGNIPKEVVDRKRNDQVTKMLAESSNENPQEGSEANVEAHRGSGDGSEVSSPHKGGGRKRRSVSRQQEGQVAPVTPTRRSLRRASGDRAKTPDSSANKDTMNKLISESGSNGFERTIQTVSAKPKSKRGRKKKVSVNTEVDLPSRDVTEPFVSQGEFNHVAQCEDPVLVKGTLV